MLERALEFYADNANWHEDDWNILSIISWPDYGDPGHIARLALNGEYNLLIDNLDENDRMSNE